MVRPPDFPCGGSLPAAEDTAPPERGGGEPRPQRRGAPERGKAGGPRERGKAGSPKGPQGEGRGPRGPRGPPRGGRGEAGAPSRLTRAPVKATMALPLPGAAGQSGRCALLACAGSWGFLPLALDRAPRLPQPAPRSCDIVHRVNSGRDRRTTDPARGHRPDGIGRLSVSLHISTRTRRSQNPCQGTMRAPCTERPVQFSGEIRKSPGAIPENVRSAAQRRRPSAKRAPVAKRQDGPIKRKSLILAQNERWRQA